MFPEPPSQVGSTQLKHPSHKVSEYCGGQTENHSDLHHGRATYRMTVWYILSVGFVRNHGMRDAGLLIYSVQFTFSELVLRKIISLRVRKWLVRVSPLVTAVVLIREKHFKIDSTPDSSVLPNVLIAVSSIF